MLPWQHEWVLRNLNVSWELTLHTHGGQKVVLEQSRAYFLESSAIVRWSAGCFPSYHHISSTESAKKLAWRSRILNLYMQTHP